MRALLIIPESVRLQYGTLNSEGFMFDWITGVIEGSGYLGITLLMLLEHVFPPIPSELIMPLAGYVASQEDLALSGVILAGTLGSVAGTTLWYWAGTRLGAQRVRNFVCRRGRWVALTASDIDRTAQWFERHGESAVLIGRIIPTVRSLISLPAGIACMPFRRYLVFTLIGSTLWTALLAIAGYMLGGRYDQVGDWVNPVSTVVFIAIAVAYVYRVFTIEPESD